MYKKITLAITLLFAAILIYLANRFDNVADLKLAYANEILPYYEDAANKFWKVGIMLFFAIWLWANVISIKTKQLFWLWIPFLLMIAVAITDSYHDEAMFHFKKANDLWNGSFSLSYFFGAGEILITGFVILINYFALKRYFQRQAVEGSV